MTMTHEAAVLAEDDFRAIRSARSSRNIHQMIEAYRQSRESRNYLFLRYGRKGIEAYLQKGKETAKEVKDVK